MKVGKDKSCKENEFEWCYWNNCG